MYERNTKGRDLMDNGLCQSGRRGSNPRPLAWKANALPTELLPQFSFLRRAPLPSFRGRRRPGGPCGRRWIRTTEVERQQIYSLPHLATLVSARYSNFKNLFPPTLSAPSRGPERRRRHRADGGIRTPDQLITNQLLWPTELHRHGFRGDKNSDKILMCKK